MSLFLFLTVVQALVAAALVGVILMQRSEGGGLGIGGGGSPSGLMSARGAADFLTRATKWLAVTFVTLSIIMAAVAVKASSGGAISSTLDRTIAPDPLAGQADKAAPAATTAPAAPASPVPSDDPLSGATN